MRPADRAQLQLWMRLALNEASRGLGQTSPNPAVGAVLTRKGARVATGYHRKAGTAHAEIVAIQAAGPRARGADLYTTLEPCNHYGRTPPCTEAIIQAGVRRVICATEDPNPLVNGGGIARLRSAGIEVLVGVLKEEAEWLNRAFFKVVRTGMPWVTLKAAVSLDGKIATAAGKAGWISGKQSRERVHQLRHQVDAVLVGANTVRLDNPRLTARLPRKRGRNPVRVVLDSGLRLPERLRVFTSAPNPRTVVATLEPADARKASRLSKRGVEVWTLRPDAGGVDLRDLLRRLAAGGLLHVLAEGGAALHRSLLSQGLADEIMLFVAPMIVGADGLSWVGPLGVRELSDAVRTTQLTCEQSGDDLLIQTRPVASRLTRR